MRRRLRENLDAFGAACAYIRELEIQVGTHIMWFFVFTVVTCVESCWQLFAGNEKKVGVSLPRDQEVAFLRAEAAQLREAVGMLQRQDLGAVAHKGHGGERKEEEMSEEDTTPAVNPCPPAHATGEKGTHRPEQTCTAEPICIGASLEHKTRCFDDDSEQEHRGSLNEQLRALQSEHSDLQSLHDEATCIISQDKDTIAHLEKQVQNLREKWRKVQSIVKSVNVCD